MKKIQELYDSRMSAVVELRNAVDTAEKENKPVDQEKFDKISADIDNFDAEIARLEKLEKYEASLERPVRTPVVPVEQKFSNEEKQKEAFFNYLRTGDRQAFYALGQVNGSALVPTPTAVAIYAAMTNSSVIRQNAQVIKTDSTTSLGIMGSATGYWTPELSAYTESTPSENTETLGAHKLTCVIGVSEELLQDKFFDVESYIIAEFGLVLAGKSENGYIQGSGTSQPKGIFNNSTYGGVTVPTTTAASSAAITTNEVIDTLYNMKAVYRNGAKWVVNPSTAKAIYSLKDTTGQYIWQPSYQAGRPATLLGYDLLESDGVAAFSTGNVVGGLVSFPNVIVGDRGTLEITRLNEVAALSGKVLFKAMMRTDIALKSGNAVSKLVLA